MRVLLVFLDGVGIGPVDSGRNPFAAAELPALTTLLGGRRLVREDLETGGYEGAGVSLRALDATLGVDGRPQSGTGQTALLTGVNAAQRMGRHFGPWVPTALRPMLAESSLFARALVAGSRVAFANAYPRRHFEPGGAGSRRPGAIPLAASTAGVLERDEHSLRAGLALASSITTDAWRRHVDPDAPPIEPDRAGELLAAIAARNDFTLFAHYDTDYAGHRGDLWVACAALERVDAFLGGLTGRLGADTLLLVTSDHGNLEAVTTGHTLNDVPLLAIGPGADRVTRGATSLLDLAPLILGLLDRPTRYGGEVPD